MKKVTFALLISLLTALSGAQAFAAPEQGAYDYRSFLGKWTAKQCDIHGGAPYKNPSSVEVSLLSDPEVLTPALSIKFDSQPAFFYLFMKINRQQSPDLMSYTTQDGLYASKTVKRSCPIGAPGMCIDRDSTTVAEVRAKSEKIALFSFELKEWEQTTFVFSCELERSAEQAPASESSRQGL